MQEVLSQKGVPDSEAELIVATVGQMDKKMRDSLTTLWATGEKYHQDCVKSRLVGEPPPGDPRFSMVGQALLWLKRAEDAFDDQWTEEITKAGRQLNSLRRDINDWRGRPMSKHGRHPRSGTTGGSRAR